MRINTNITAMIANNSLQRSQNKLSLSIERLSSGYKINGSGDDPAGCAISEKMRLQIKGLDQADNNAADGVSVLNTAEGALQEVNAMLVRMKELTVQAANDVNSDDERQAIQDELDNINQEIDRITTQTEFNTQPLLNGNLSRRVYSNIAGVKQLSVTDNYVAGKYSLNIVHDARQAIVVGGNATKTTGLTASQAGSVSINGYAVELKEGDTFDDIMGKLTDGADKAGARAFVTDSTGNDTRDEVLPDGSNGAGRGTTYAGYSVAPNASNPMLVFMTKEYGSHMELEISCSNRELAGILGISAAYDGDDGEGIKAQGLDVKAEFATDPTSGKRLGFDNSAVLSTKGTVVTVKDVDNKEFILDVPGNICGTAFNDVLLNPIPGNNAPVTVTQEVTDVGTMSIHIGANMDQNIKLDIPEVSTYTLGIDTINVMTSFTSQQAVAKVDEAISKANAVRSKIGAYENRFEHTRNNLAVSNENVTSALATMVDTDMAEEMTNYTSLNVMTQAATSILSQANERPSNVLQLLQ